MLSNTNFAMLSKKQTWMKKRSNIIVLIGWEKACKRVRMPLLGHGGTTQRKNIMRHRATNL